MRTAQLAVSRYGRELLHMLRAPEFCVPVVAFPLAVYVLFCLVLGPPEAEGGVARHLLATYTTFGVVTPGLFGLVVGLTIERKRGLLVSRRTWSRVFVGAKLLLACACAGAASVLLMVLAATAGQLVLDALQCFDLVLSVLGLGRLL